MQHGDNPPEHRRLRRPGDCQVKQFCFFFLKAPLVGGCVRPQPLNLFVPQGYIPIPVFPPNPNATHVRNECGEDQK